ncbi:MAG: PIN domain-containing protein [Pseudohongiella sp.]|nr:PIN domain-containing protein [Pseudohongiella sp.]MDO9521681.1 PIN domain-containing protein [Pseudohongiella sp.]MDP2127574.1 PIN domain-containing protein [Pseudohongiella sp.]
MSGERSFLDTNILLYLYSADDLKARQAEALVRAGGVVSVQVLNELASVLRRKFKYSWAEINHVLGVTERLLEVEPLTLDGHRVGRALAARYSLSVYDAMIVAAAQQSGCRVLYSEDMQHGLKVSVQLRIENPFL